MNYTKFRSRYEILIYLTGFVLIIASAALRRDAIFYVVGAFFIVALLEGILVKCPNCRKRPIKFLRKFPTECHLCHEKF